MTNEARSDIKERYNRHEVSKCHTEVNLRNPLHAGDKARKILKDFESQGNIPRSPKQG